MYECNFLLFVVISNIVVELFNITYFKKKLNCLQWFPLTTHSRSWIYDIYSYQTSMKCHWKECGQCDDTWRAWRYYSFSGVVVKDDANTATTNRKHKATLFYTLIDCCWHCLTFQQLLCFFAIRSLWCIPHPPLGNELFWPPSRHFDAFQLRTWNATYRNIYSRFVSFPVRRVALLIWL